MVVLMEKGQLKN